MEDSSRTPAFYRREMNTKFEKDRDTPPGYKEVSPEVWLGREGEGDVSMSLKSALFGAEVSIPYYSPVGEMFSSLDMDVFKPLTRSIDRILTESDFGERIERGEYALVLGADTTARVPTFFLKEVLKGICVGNNLPIVPTYFYINSPREKEYMGAWEGKMGEYAEYLKGKNPSESRKILLCTEYVSTGRSIRDTARVLKEHGWQCDVLSFGGRSNVEIGDADEYYSGHVGDFDDVLRRNFYISGVCKKGKEEIYAYSVERLSKKEYKERLESEEARIKKIKKVCTQQDAMQLVRFSVKYIGANVARAYLDWRAGKFTLPNERV